MVALLQIDVENYRCLRDVKVPLGPLNVLVGPNGAGKSTLLDVIQFLGDSVRSDLGPTMERRGGFDDLLFRGERARTPAVIRIGIRARVTAHATETAPDEYRLWFRQLRQAVIAGIGAHHDNKIQRGEQFTFKRVRGPGRRIRIEGTKVEFMNEGSTRRPAPTLSLQQESLGLSSLPRLAAQQGGDQVRRLASLFETFRVFDINVDRARRPAAVKRTRALQADASNLADFLHGLSADRPLFERLVEDARAIVPGLSQIHFRKVGGAEEAVVVELEEKWLPGRTPLAAASYGTVRTLALLAMLYDPDPPKLTCVEEIDHGLHPYAFDRIIERVREASARTQFLIATHSPALVNRLDPRELIVCERDPETGAARIPAVDAEDVVEAQARAGDDLGLGELWFTGTLGGVP